MLISICLRVLSMGARFSLLFYLVKRSSVELVATYGMATAVVAFASFALGLDMYVQASRNVKRPKIYFRYLSNQIIVALACYGVLAIILAVIPAFDFVQSSYWLLLGLIFSDFYLQEVSRVFLSFGEFHRANLLQFARLGAWPAVVLGLMLGNLSELNDVHDVLQIWLLVNCTFVVIASLPLVRRLQGFSFTPSLRLASKSWQRQALIFTSSLSLLLYAGVDRLVVGSLESHLYVASYVFYSSIYGVVLTLIYTGLVNPYYARFADRTIPWADKRPVLISFGIAAVLFCILCLVGISLVLDDVMVWIGRSEYLAMDYLRGYFAVFVLLSVIALIPHYALFSIRKDKAIAYSSIYGGLAFISTVTLMEYAGMTDSVPTGICLGVLTMGVCKFALYPWRSRSGQSVSGK